MADSILQDWVQELGLRFQGVLLSAIRGCDTAHRHDLSKVLIRVYRAEILKTHCKDPRLSKSFILFAEVKETAEMMNKFLDDCDHYPSHYLMHFVHAAEILGYYHPDLQRRELWNSFYAQCCRKLHLHPEHVTELNARLEEDEDSFHAKQKPTVIAWAPTPPPAPKTTAQRETERVHHEGGS